MRPGSIHKCFRKKSAWIDARLTEREAGAVVLEKAPTVKEQMGHKVKVTPVYHSPPAKRECRECGKITTNGFLCEPCQDHEDAMNDTELGWDGHK